MRLDRGVLYELSILLLIHSQKLLGLLLSAITYAR